MDLPVRLMHHAPDRSWITDPDPEHPKGPHPKLVPNLFKTRETDSHPSVSRNDRNARTLFRKTDEQMLLEISQCIKLHTQTGCAVKMKRFGSVSSQNTEVPHRILLRASCVRLSSVSK